MDLLDIEDTIEPRDSIVGWVVWKDVENEMVVLGDEEGQPRLFASYSAAEWERGFVDAVAAVTQERYDELCGKKSAVIEDVRPVKGDPVKDSQEEWVQSILAKIDEQNARLSRWMAGPAPRPLKEVVKPAPAPPEREVELGGIVPEREVELGGIVPEREAKRRGVRGDEVSAAGFVYLILADGLADVYKVGYSIDPVRRLKCLQSSSPVSLSLEWVIPCWGNDGTELKIHRKFAEQRLQGEWFRLSKQDVEWVQGLQQGYRVRRQGERGSPL